MPIALACDGSSDGLRLILRREGPADRSFRCSVLWGKPIIPNAKPQESETHVSLLHLLQPQAHKMKSTLFQKGRLFIFMSYQINTPEKPYTFEASSFTAACVVATLLGGGFYSLWQDGKQVMPVFMFGGVEKWFRRIFDKNFTGCGAGGFPGRDCADLHDYPGGETSGTSTLSPGAVHDPPLKRNSAKCGQPVAPAIQTYSLWFVQVS